MATLSTVLLYTIRYIYVFISVSERGVSNINTLRYPLDSSDGYNSDESSIFRLVKRKCDKTRNSTTDVRLMGQDDLRCLDTSDPVIIISDGWYIIFSIYLAFRR